MAAMNDLDRLHGEIEARVQAIRSDHPDWLCGKGCDTCCRRLAELPRLTAAEWRLLRTGLAALPAARLAEIRQATQTLSQQSSGPVACPLLERSSGSCPVYAVRPVACRSYGFYVQRDRGLYCAEIEAQVAGGRLADVVWGNHDAVDRLLAGLGEARPLSAWLELWQGDESSAA